MKHSHLQTPRTLDACAFQLDADPIERPPRPVDREDRIVLWACAVGAIALALIILFVPEAR